MAFLNLGGWYKAFKITLTYRHPTGIGTITVSRLNDFRHRDEYHGGFLK